MEGFSKVLVTGGAGYLGSKLCEALQQLNIPYVSVDVISKENPAGHAKYESIYKANGVNDNTRCGNEIYTTHHGTVCDKAFIDNLIKAENVDVIFHTAALHKPNISEHSKQDFIDTNITGTLNLLESAVTHKVKAFVFTSTTSLFGEAMLPEELAPSIGVTEELVPRPKNIYGVTKLAAENICQLIHQQHKLPVVVLRTSRFFPEDDDSGELKISGDNYKANEFLYRRVDVRDIIQAHFQAAMQASRIGFDVFIISAVPPQFTEEDLAKLNVDAPSVIANYFPQYEQIYKKLGWKMFPKIDRVYYPTKAVKKLGYSPKFDFMTHLEEVSKQICP